MKIPKPFTDLRSKNLILKFYPNLIKMDPKFSCGKMTFWT